MIDIEINKEFLDFLEQCSKKDKNAWDHFVEKYSNLIYKYIIKTFKRYNYFFQEDVLEEIFHKVFLALFDDDCRRLKNFKGQNERSFLAYLKEIVFHISIDFLREQKNFVTLDDMQDTILANDGNRELEKMDLTKIIKIIKDELCDRHKYLFKLIYEEELELSEIAEIMNLKPNAIHQLKFRMINSIIDIVKKKKLFYDSKFSPIPSFV